jgi:hypothetical protein
MNASQTQSSIPLAPPGAGLPWLELQVARGIFYSGLALATLDKDKKRIQDEEAKTAALIAPISSELLARPVLIERMRGIEDSSRNWSVYMTLAHVAIVNTAVYRTIQLLLQGEIPARAASTAAVKPPPNTGVEAVTTFHESAQKLLELLDQHPDLRTEKRYSHPWFGPLDARGWLFMAGFHMRLHRKQVETILRVGQAA